MIKRTTVTYCDRCGKVCEEYPYNHGRKLYRRQYRRKFFLAWEGKDERLDLCQACYDGLDEWMMAGRESKNSKTDETTDKEPIWMTPAGHSDHDCEAWYKCPKCGEFYGSWSFYHNNQRGGDIITCKCGQKLYVPN